MKELLALDGTRYGWRGGPAIGLVRRAVNRRAADGAMKAGGSAGAMLYKTIAIQRMNQNELPYRNAWENQRDPVAVNQHQNIR